MVWYRVQEYADHVPHPLLYLRQNLSKASHILIFDAIYIKIRGQGYCVHIAYDTGIGVIHFAIDDSENATAYAVMLNMLEREGYTAMVVISDGHGGIESAISDRKIPHQRCVFHLLQELRRDLAIRGELIGGDKVLYTRIKGIWKAKKIEDLAERINQLRKILFCFRSRRQRMVIKKFWEGLPEATLHLSFEEKIPNTSNLLENLNGQIRARIKTMRGVKSKQSLFNLLKILFYFRNYK